MESQKVVLLLNDQGGAVLHLEQGKISPTIRAEMGGHPPIVMLEQIYLESHPNDSRLKIEDSGTSQTLSSRMGTGGEYPNDVGVEDGRKSQRNTNGNKC